MKTSIKETVRKFLSLSVSYILSVMMVVMFFSAVIKLTFLNEDFLRSAVTKSGYVDNLMTDLQKSLCSHGIASGFGKSFFEETVSRDILRGDIYREISRIYDSSEGKRIDAAGFKENLYDKLIIDIDKRKIENTENVNEALLYLSDVSTDTYQSFAEFPFAFEISSLIPKIQKMISNILVVTPAVILLTLAVLFRITPSKREKTRNIMFALGGSFLTAAVPIAYLLLGGYMEKLALGSEALYGLAVTYLSTVLEMSLAFSFLFVLLWFGVYFYRRKFLFGK